MSKSSLKLKSEYFSNFLNDPNTGEFLKQLHKAEIKYPTSRFLVASSVL
ncbi:hypothetical protein CKC_03525 [Candidatus Liberibacter solanacearum CLso-ZC1]|uniref:Uncharacterized protein n=1 Tax=Liberibacter solanacearum (strain CLso-ZC1) TaxID=658172 RepID=E4UBE9_LIBSC|nr:hypothetical protein CKC_03525 [Candidatus Liberibacter solanacearum CLso-ZC1]